MRELSFTAVPIPDHGVISIANFLSTLLNTALFESLE